MSDVLDELREMLEGGFGDDKRHPYLTKTRMRKTVDAFAAAHPGLKDDTRTCRCGAKFAGGQSDLRNEDYNDWFLCRKCGEEYAVKVHRATWPARAKGSACE